LCGPNMLQSLSPFVKSYKGSGVPFLLGSILSHRGWKRTNDDNWTFYWKSARPSKTELLTCKPHQFVNHFPQTHNITKKGHLQFLLKSFYAKYGEIFDFVPSSFLYTIYTKDLLMRYFGNDTKKIWIGKPVALSRGRGILITRNLEDFFFKSLNQQKMDFYYTPPDDIVHSNLDQPRDTLTHPNNMEMTTEDISKKPYMVIVQEYIPNPHLISGYKHDMRIYVLITSLHPLTIYLFNDGLSRFCTEEFSLEDLNPMRHLTNTSIHHKLWQEGKISQDSEERFNQAITTALGPGDFSKRRLRSMFAHLYDCGIDLQHIWRQIKKVIILTLLPLTEEPKVDTKCFELLGFDILLTDKLKPMLIEVNLGPSLSSTCPTDNIVKMPLLQDMLDIVLGEPQRKQRLMPIDPQSDYISKQGGSGDFELIFPFNKATERASRELAEGIHTQKNMDKIVEEVCVSFGNGVGKEDKNREKRVVEM